MFGWQVTAPGPDVRRALTRVPMAVPRRDAVALPLPDGQILVAGGTGADGEPVGALELYTPDPT